MLIICIQKKLDWFNALNVNKKYIKLFHSMRNNNYFNITNKTSSNLLEPNLLSVAWLFPQSRSSQTNSHKKQYALSRYRWRSPQPKLHLNRTPSANNVLDLLEPTHKIRNNLLQPNVYKEEYEFWISRHENMQWNI